MRIEQKTLIYLSAILLCLFSCESNDYKYFDGTPAIHFNLETNQMDSIELSFTKYKTDTIIYAIPVQIESYGSTKDRYYKVEVIADSTTGIPGKHYKELENHYTINANTYNDSLYITFYNTDSILEMKSFRLYLEIKKSSDFIPGIYDKINVDIRFSNKLNKPTDWDYRYVDFFGEYSLVKHKILLEILQLTEIPDIYNAGAFGFEYDSYGRFANNYFTENTIYDENGKLITPWF